MTPPLVTALSTSLPTSSSSLGSIPPRISSNSRSGSRSSKKAIRATAALRKNQEKERIRALRYSKGEQKHMTVATIDMVATDSDEKKIKTIPHAALQPRKVERILRAHGYKKTRFNGHGWIYAHDGNGRRTTVPDDPVVTPCIMKRIIRQTLIPMSEF